MRWLPRSLFGRLVLVLLAGLVTAQLIGLGIHLQDRSEVLLRAGGMQSAQRIADTVRLLESTDATGRRQIARVLADPPLIVRLDLPPLPAAAGTGTRAEVFAALLRRALDDGWPVTVAIEEAPATTLGPGHGPRHGAPGAMRGYYGGPPPGTPGAGHGPPPARLAYVAQVRLHDGTLATFDARPPQAADDWPYRLLASLAVLLLSVVALSLLAVRWLVRPLRALAAAADDLGRDIHGAPMDESGPVEVARAARAFNTMRARLLAYLRERTSLLAAMSHDLKTPVTRLRLRAELLPDAALRKKFTDDLEELESLVTATLDYLRGAQGAEPVRPVDIDALLESIQADAAEAGGPVQLGGRTRQPYPARPGALKRCLRNLVENAIKYGQTAHVEVQDHPDALVITVRDDGPGLPPDELERVFEPFYRAEASRNRDTGGTGLGLTIARSVAELHGGTLTLSNAAGGGLQARLVLPRGGVTPATGSP